MQQHDKLISDLKNIGVNVEMVRMFNPTEKQLIDLRDGLVKLHAEFPQFFGKKQ